jgi:hypothetical protein
MAYTSVPTSTTGDLVTAAWFNTYIKDNFAYLYNKFPVVTADIDDNAVTNSKLSSTVQSRLNTAVAEVQSFSFAYNETVTTGDGAGGYVTIPAKYNGWVLSAVHARVESAPSGGTVTIQIHNATDSVDMLSTRLTIDDGETGSDTAATPAVINTSNDDVASYDLLRIDIDAANSAVGLIVQLVFEVA